MTLDAFAGVRGDAIPTRLYRSTTQDQLQPFNEDDRISLGIQSAEKCSRCRILWSTVWKDGTNGKRLELSRKPPDQGVRWS